MERPWAGGGGRTVGRQEVSLRSDRGWYVPSGKRSQKADEAKALCLGAD